MNLSLLPNKLKLLFIAVLALFSFVVVSPTQAQVSSPPTSGAPSASIDPNQVTFPIEKLGGCTDKTNCLQYCKDPVNYVSCEEFAKEKGFYKQDKTQAADEKLLKNAQTVLGCATVESCQAFCSQTGNHAKCDAFAKEEDLVGGYVDNPTKPEYLKVAKDVLGCDSGTSCKSFCDDPTHAAACGKFAQQVGLSGGEVKQGPGGCTSETTCKSFCSDPNNFNACKQFAPPENNGAFRGPGGCTSQNDCRSVCEKNPDQCRSYAPGSNGRYVPVACPDGQTFGPGGACTLVAKAGEAGACAGSGKYWDGKTCQDKTPAGIVAGINSAFFQARADMGNCKTPTECYDYCKTNGSCPGFNATYPRPDDKYVPGIYATPGTLVKHDPVPEMGNCTTAGECYDYCKANPSKCPGLDSKAPRPVDTYIPGTYYTPPVDGTYTTPPITNYYVTPVYYTPPAGSTYTTPAYYTPGIYSTPTYYTPPTGSNYTTPTYYTPGTQYYTPSGEYPTPNYPTPRYYTPPDGSNYATPTYYTPAAYTTPQYYTPPAGSNYTTPTYYTPTAYVTPQYYTPSGGGSYTTPTYYTPPTYTTPSYYTPPPGSNYTTPNYAYPTPGSGYATPSYNYPTPGSYNTPSYYTPSGTYTTPSYNYPTPGTYYTPSGGYSYPTPGGSYTSPTYNTPSYNTPSYNTPTAYLTPTYNTPSYNTPSYNTPSYNTPSYNTPSYNTPSYDTPSYGTPGSTQGMHTERTWWDIIWQKLTHS